jgi:hypothetical protein
VFCRIHTPGLVILQIRTCSSIRFDMQEAGDSSSIQYISTGTSCILYNASWLPPDDRQGSTADHNLVLLNITRILRRSLLYTIHVRLHLHHRAQSQHPAWALFRFILEALRLGSPCKAACTSYPINPSLTTHFPSSAVKYPAVV